MRVPESYKGGRKKWVADVAQVMQVKQQSLANLTRPARPDTHLRTEGLVECWFSLGLYHHWQGDEDVARADWSQAATLARIRVERDLPTLTAEDAPSYAWLARTAALSAALSGQESLARTFFSYMERFSTGLVTGHEERPVDQAQQARHPNRVGLGG